MVPHIMVEQPEAIQCKRLPFCGLLVVVLFLDEQVLPCPLDLLISCCFVLLGRVNFHVLWLTASQLAPDSFCSFHNTQL